MTNKIRIFSWLLLAFTGVAGLSAQSLTLNEEGYFQKRGVNVMVFLDIYPEGHQGGVGIYVWNPPRDNGNPSPK